MSPLTFEGYGLSGGYKHFVSVGFGVDRCELNGIFFDLCATSESLLLAEQGNFDAQKFKEQLHN